MKNNMDISEIIQRYFRGQLSEYEYELLTDFLKDPAGKEAFDQARHQWNQEAKLDEEGARNWNRLEYKINQPENKALHLPVVHRIWFNMAKAAAMLAIGLFIGGGTYYLLSGNKTKSEDLVFETTRGQKSMVTLPDGSQVWINAKSRLVYHSFTSSKRSVELSGEAFFKVAHDKDAPFVVKTDKCEVEVLGTTFNVMAYNEFGRQEITLLTGKVNVHSGLLEKDIEPGQSLILKNQQMEVVSSNGSQASGWVENKFNFHDIPLSELMKRLENWYDVDITLDNPSGREVNFSGIFKNEETIWQVLDAIKVYTPIQYIKTDLRQIVVSVK
ncbi:MAG: FecR domain-containing protein [Verrucomicrobiota bacterium]